MAIGTRTRRLPAPRRGPTDSEDFNAFQDGAVTDLGTAIAEINALTAKVEETRAIRFLESADERVRIERATADRVVRNIFDAAAGDPITTVVDFGGFTGPDYEINYGGLAEARRARLDPVHRQVTLPYNAVVNRVYGVSTTTGLPVLPGTIETEVVGYNESGGTVVSGTKKYAVNGMNQDYWRRRVRFPIESDVDYVEATFQVNLPTLHTSYVNMLSIHPFPQGWVDVTEIKYSTTTSDPSIDLSGFTAVNSVGFRRWHFPEVAMTSVRIRLRTKYFVEENGFKVFNLGLQELLLQLVDFDRTANAGSGPLAPATGNGIVTKIDAPAGYTFDQITRFYSNPTWATGAADNKVYWRIYADASLTDERWSSWSDPTPQDTPVDLSTDGLSSIYVVLTLEWDDSALVSPAVNRFALRYSVM
jgi:hypothetical protein